VICVDGDGGFAHCWPELETAVRNGLGVITVILNNRSLAYTRDDEEAQFGAHTDATELSPVDHAAIARACGASGIRIENPGEFIPALKAALSAKGPTLFDVIVDPEARPPVSELEGKFGKPF
jgi:acetolactate synthase-1/2/3 large subunit